MSTAALVSAFHPDFRDIYKGLQSHRVTSDIRQQMSLALERQLSGRQLVNSYASLINLPSAASQGSISALSTLPSIPGVKTTAKQHPPLTASNSVANCNAASHLKALATREHRKLDRSVSEPVSQQTVRQVQPNSSRYKTELCRPYEENGTCKYGDKCQFAHGIGELRTLTRHPKYKTELCRTFHSTGFCPYGPRCHFIHNSEDSKKCLLTTLQSSSIPVTGRSPSKHVTSKDYDICSFSIGSAGELSPTGSTSSSGSPTSSFNGFFLEDNHSSFPLPQVPQTAPPTLNSSFFNSDYPFLNNLPPLPTLVQQDEFSQEESVDGDLATSIDMLVSDLEMNSLDSNSNADLLTNPDHSAAIDINRNIRLPIFHSLVGNSP